MIKIPSYLDMFAKIIDIVGVDLQSGGTNTTKKSDLKELRDFNNQIDVYEKAMTKFLKILAGTDQQKKLLINNFMNVIESTVRYLVCKNYYTLASQQRAMWGLAVFYCIPQLACMLSLYKNHFGIPDIWLKYKFMLPIRQSNKIISSLLQLKNYLEDTIGIETGNKLDKNDDYLQNYFKEWKNEVIPNKQSQLKLIRALVKSYPDINNREEIESSINVAIVAARIYRLLCTTFKDEELALMLVDYFWDCFKAADQLHNQNLAEISQSCQSSDFESMMTLHLALLCSELVSVKVIPEPGTVDVFNQAQRFRESLRMDLFTAFNAFLGDTKRSEVDKFEAIDTRNFSNGILRYNLDYNDFESDDGPNDFDCYFADLAWRFKHSKTDLDEVLISRILAEIESHIDFKHYEHEYLYYKALHHLAKNELLLAIEKLQEVRKVCTKITAGETKLQAMELLIVLRLWKDKRNQNYANLNSEIKATIDCQPEEVILTSNIPDPVIRFEHIYRNKIIDLIRRFNKNGYKCYQGTECVKFNPYEKFNDFTMDFFKLYDSPEPSSESDKMKIETIIKKLLTGREAKYSYKQPIVALLQLDIKEALQHLDLSAMAVFHIESKLPYADIERLLSSPEILEQISASVERLMGKSSKLNTESSNESVNSN